MHPAFVRRSVAPFLVLVALTSAACGGDVGASRLKGTHSGMPRDSVLDAIGTGSVAASGNDSVRVVNGHHRQAFLLNGQNVEVIWFSETPGTVDDSITKETRTPVVLVNDTLAGWGWSYFTSEGTKLGLVDPRPAAKP